MHEFLKKADNIVGEM